MKEHTMKCNVCRDEGVIEEVHAHEECCGMYDEIAGEMVCCSMPIVNYYQTLTYCTCEAGIFEQMKKDSNS